MPAITTFTSTPEPEPRPATASEEKAVAATVAAESKSAPKTAAPKLAKAAGPKLAKDGTHLSAPELPEPDESPDHKPTYRDSGHGDYSTQE